MREDIILSITGFIMVMLIIVGCSNEQQQPKTFKRLMRVCTCEQQAKAANFMKETIKQANNMSDEEMEDVIYQLEQTAVRLHCPQKLMKYPQHENGLNEPLNLDSCETVYNY